MMSDRENLSGLKQQAESVGLTRLTDKHLQQLARATERSRQIRSNPQINLSVADEPAHVYTLVEKG